MPLIATNGVELEYESFGPAQAPAILLIMGLGAQMILWDEEFCEALAQRGYRVFRFDNRDVGRSTKLEGAGMPNVVAALADVAQGRKPSAAPRFGKRGNAGALAVAGTTSLYDRAGKRGPFDWRPRVWAHASCLALALDWH